LKERSVEQGQFTSMYSPELRGFAYKIHDTKAFYLLSTVFSPDPSVVSRRKSGSPEPVQRDIGKAASEYNAYMGGVESAEYRLETEREMDNARVLLGSGPV
jgi:hypothetical protein